MPQEQTHNPEILRRIKRSMRTSLNARALKKALQTGIDYNKIVVVCRGGRGFLDNPKYLVYALEELCPQKYDFVLLVQNTIGDLPPFVRQVRIGTSAALFELVTARFWISDNRFDWPIDITPQQYYFQTWHACMGPKRAEGDAEEKLHESYLAVAKRDGSFTSFMYANDNIHAQAFAHSYWNTGPVVRCGAPRNKVLVCPDVAASVALRRSLGVPKGHGMLLYAPTFRHGLKLDAHPINLQRCVEALEARLGIPFVAAYRLHLEATQAAIPAYLEGFINVSDYPDAQDLLCATDVLISDYSSIMEDFMLLGRPCFTYAPDLASYEEERGFYYSLDSRPAPLAQNEEELFKAIAAFDSSQFEQNRSEFFRMLDVTEDGQGDRALAQLIHKLMPEGTSIENAIDACTTAGLFSRALENRGTAPNAQALAAEWDAW